MFTAATKYVYCNYSSHNTFFIIQYSLNLSAKLINLTYIISTDKQKIKVSWQKIIMRNATIPVTKYWTAAVPKLSWARKTPAYPRVL